jgi:hypothetical protein
MDSTPRNPVPDHFEVLLSQKIFPLGEYPDYAPLLRGRKVHISNGFRQAATGSVATDGTRVKLPWMRFAGRRYTSVEALEWYAARLSRPAGVAAPASRRREAAEAASSLDKLGI